MLASVRVLYQEFLNLEETSDYSSDFLQVVLHFTVTLVDDRDTSRGLPEIREGIQLLDLLKPLLFE